MKLLLGDILSHLRKTRPLIHHITNYVTVNDCANITLAVGAAPVMADDIHEAAEMTAMAQALVLNIGTLHSQTVLAMEASGEKAKEIGIPIVFDPVGCGATLFRTQTAKHILQTVKPSVVRGNVSEIASLFGWDVKTRGVDAAGVGTDRDVKALARMAAQSWGNVVAVTGAVDIVTDGTHMFAVENGCEAMAGVTGTGCMCTSVMASFCGAAPAHMLESAAAALIFMGLCGEHAWQQAGERGPGNFHMAMIDAAGRMTDDDLMKEAKYYEI